MRGQIRTSARSSESSAPARKSSFRSSTTATNCNGVNRSVVATLGWLGKLAVSGAVTSCLDCTQGLAAVQIATLEREPLEKAQGAAMVELDRVVASETFDRPAAEIGTEIEGRGRPALRDGTAPGNGTICTSFGCMALTMVLRVHVVALDPNHAAFAAPKAIRPDGKSDGRTACAIMRNTGSCPKSTPYPGSLTLVMRNLVVYFLCTRLQSRYDQGGRIASETAHPVPAQLRA